MSKDAFTEFLIRQVTEEEARRAQAKRLKEKREEDERLRWNRLVAKAKHACNRVWKCYERVDEKGLLGNLSLEKAKETFRTLHQSCDSSPNYVLSEINVYEELLAKTVEEEKFRKGFEQQLAEAKATAHLEGAMEYMKYYQQYKEIEKRAVEAWSRNPDVDMDAIIEHFKKNYPPPYDRCQFTEREMRWFCAAPRQAKTLMFQLNMLGLT